MKRWMIILSVLAVFSGSCKKKIMVDGTPECLGKRITTFDKEQSCEDIRVDEYLFQSKPVYLFEPGTCGADFTTEVIDTDCNTLGHLHGIAGNAMINGENFSSATYVRNVWHR